MKVSGNVEGVTGGFSCRERSKEPRETGILCCKCKKHVKM